MPKQTEDFIKTYRGLFTGTQIECEDGTIIECRPYASRYEEFINKRGFFNVNFADNFGWGIIVDAVLEDR